MGSELAFKPERMTLANLEKPEDRLVVLFNPEELPEELSVNYAMLTVPGFSQEVAQYVNTASHKIGPLQLYSVGEVPREVAAMDDFRRFLLSLCYPSQSASDVPTGGPPRVLFVWPNLMSLVCRVKSLKFDHKRFAPDGSSTRWMASLELFEARAQRITAEEVRRMGTIRSGSGFQG